MPDLMHKPGDVSESNLAPPNEAFAQIASDCWNESNGIIAKGGFLLGGYLGASAKLSQLHELSERGELVAYQPDDFFKNSRPLVVTAIVGYVATRVALTAGCVLDRYNNHGADYLLMAM
jgi:hypothetical protein